MLLRRLPSMVLVLAAFVFAWPVAADCEPAGPLEEELRIAPVAFVGTVVAAEGGSARFAVEEVWAGSVGSEVDVRGLGGWAAVPAGGPAMGLGEPARADDALIEDERDWKVGERYLVIPTIDGEVLTDHQCTATTEWRPELAELRPAEVVTHPAPPGAGIPLPLTVAGIAILVVAIGSAVAFRRS